MRRGFEAVNGDLVVIQDADLEYSPEEFPMLIELSCQPDAARQQQPEPAERAGDKQEAAEIVDEQADREADGREHGHVGQEIGRA